MAEINRVNARMWSMLGARGTFGLAMLELAAKHDFTVLSADLCESSGLAKFRDNYKDRFFNVGIAEQDLIGIAAGIASEGQNVFATSFAPFITARCLDQIRMNLAYMKMNVKLVGLSSGYEQGNSGYSHYGIEDMGLLNCIPNITIVTPADCSEIYQCTEAAMTYDGPMYIRLTGGRFTPPVYTGDYTFTIGKGIPLTEGTDTVIFTCGTPTAHAVKAAKALNKEGISAAVVNMHTLRPFDTGLAEEYCRRFSTVFTAEEHSCKNGLGTAVAELIAEKGLGCRLVKIAAPDRYEKAGSYDYMMKITGLTADAIADRVRKELSAE